MKTSSFSRAAKIPGAISIARGSPPWFHGPRFEPLAPPWELVALARREEAIATAQIRQGGASNAVKGEARMFDAQRIYTERYQAEVLDKLDPLTVVMDLDRLCYLPEGPVEAILLCWEPPGAFCHRRLVAAWLETALGIVVPELGFEGGKR